MRSKFITFIFVFLFAIIFPQKIEAVTITINSYPTTVSSTDPFQVGVVVTGATNATNYLRVDLYKEGTSNYFGETYNGNDWYNGSDGKTYLPVQIQNASASAIITAQLGNPSTNDYIGPGAYKLKIRRYTSSGSQSSNDVQTPADLQITYVVPTPTPSPTPVPTTAPTASPTPVPTPTKTPTSIPTKSPTPKPTETPFPSPLDSSSPEILGITTSDTPLPSLTQSSEETSINKPPILAFVLIGIGVLCVGISGYLAFKKTKGSTLENNI